MEKNLINKFYLNLLSNPTDVISLFVAFWHYEASKVQTTGDYARTVANFVKAEVFC